VVVFVTIERQRAARPGPEERAVFRRRGHVLGRAFAADMPVEADHAVRRRHDDVKLVADHQDRAARFAPHRVDQLVERGRARLIEALRSVRRAGAGPVSIERARQQHALELPARQLRHLPSGEVGHAGRIERCRDLCPTRRPEAQEPLGRDRQRRVDMQPLRHVADPTRPGARATDPWSGHAPMMARRSVVLPDPFGPTMVTISPGSMERDIAQDPCGAIADAEILDVDQAHASAFSAQAGQTPASTTVRSIWKPVARAASPSAAARGCGLRLGHRLAQAADHEGGRMGGAGMGAGDEGVETFDLVDEPVFATRKSSAR
jgi:hypothetical protein